MRMRRPECIKDELIVCVECGEIYSPIMNNDEYLTLQQRLEYHIIMSHEELTHNMDEAVFNLMRTHRIYRYKRAENMELSNTFSGNVFDMKGE
jgi:hypothetical protein